MTRWARGGTANKKKANDATPWNEMVSGITGGRATKPNKTKKKKKLQNTEKGENSSRKHTQISKKEQSQKQHFNPADLEKRPKGTVALFRKRFGHGFETGTDVLAEPPKPEPTGLAAQLEQLKSSLQLSAEEEQEISKVIRKDERREQRRLKRVKQRKMSKMCFNCRQPGHDVEDCPKAKNDPEHGSGICFKCGSLEHKVGQCRMKVPAGHYPYAKCFVCGETGHLSKQCPDNPRGLYPNGGCCRQCTSVEHYLKDCPELRFQQGIQEMTLPTLDSHGSVDLDFESKKVVKKRTGPKLVKF